MSERGDFHPIMLILARFSKCILGTGFSAKKHPPELQTAGGFARRRGQAKSSQANQVHATPGQSTTTLLQSITLISSPPDDRQPAVILLLPPTRGPANPCRAAPSADIPRSENTEIQTGTELPSSRRKLSP